MNSPLSLKELVLLNNDLLQPLQSVRIPPAKKLCVSTEDAMIYSVDYNGGLRNILSKTISDTGIINYTVQWENGQKTKTKPSMLRNFYSVVENFEYEQFLKDDKKQGRGNQRGNQKAGLHARHQNDNASDEDYTSDKQHRVGSFRKQPRRTTKMAEKKYVFGPLEEDVLLDDSVPQTTKPTLSDLSILTTNHANGQNDVPKVIAESSPTPSSSNDSLSS
ncbi:hypothetical protein BC941DRAFT_419267 [Chlamydoabsidia padenii]|nr:hypothetical protein BC941DRAFT_419267 [Chlamydoabsidia padenii]